MSFRLRMSSYRLLLSLLYVGLLGMAPMAGAQSTSTFVSISESSDVVSMGFSSVPGSSYVLEFTTDPVSDIWTPTGGVMVATGTVTVAQDPVGLSVHKIYRLVGSLSPLVSLDFVPVGNAGNPNDPGGTGNGAVAYEYEIGKTEVSNDEYARFLNAVDPGGLNALGLYNPLMATWPEGGITNNAANLAGSKYEVRAGYADRPVVFVSFYDAMRFCNWLHNGAEPGGDTENGAYTLLGGTAVPTNGTTVTRNPGATAAVPSEDEWYKAAYHQPAGQAGDADDYWSYPTGTNAVPIVEAPPGGGNSANYAGATGTTTEGGAYTSAASFYGAFDQGGNVWEWIETIPLPGARLIRGGSFQSNNVSLSSASALEFTPVSEGFSVGFRVAKP